MKRLVLTTFVSALCAVPALAMPTQAELKKAQPLVAELMAPAMADFKAAGNKDKSAAAVRVADKSVEFANSAETEAAKFLLLKGSVNFYTRGEAYDKAADMVAALQANVKDVSPSVIAEITGKATGKVSETKAPRLFAQYRAAKLQVRAATEAKTLAQKLKKVKSDALQRRYAEALAVSGNWKAAYGEYAKLSDAKLKAVVEAEAKGQAKNAESGEFWWTYKPDFEDAEDLFKAHAAAFYRKALDAGEITGLKKNIVEQRIAGIAAESAVPVASSATTGKSLNPMASTCVTNGKCEIVTGGKSPFEVKDNLLTLTFKNGVKMVFVKCPAGDFKMCYDLRDFKTMPVTITRPYWFLKTVVTKRQYESVRGLGKSVDNIPEDKVHFCTYESLTANDESLMPFLNAEFGGMIPKGYVFRVPTWAEYQYAFHANTKDRNDPFYSIQDNSRFSKATEEAKASVWKGLSEFCNAWGIQELHRHSFVLDKLAEVDGIVLDGDKSKERRLIGKVAPDNAKDPLYWNDAQSPYVTRINQINDGVRIMSSEKYVATVHLVIGPDLVSEWKAKHGKK